MRFKLGTPHGRNLIAGPQNRQPPAESGGHHEQECPHSRLASPNANTRLRSAVCFGRPCSQISGNTGIWHNTDHPIYPYKNRQPLPLKRASSSGGALIVIAAL